MKINIITRVLALSLISMNALCASSGTLILQGVVSTSYDLVVTPQTAATTLNILGGESNKLVAVVTETTNNPTGFKIKLSSANAGQLKNNTVDSLTYQLSYNGGTATQPSLIPALVKTSVTAAPGGVTSNVNITFPAKPLALAGTYTDTVTVSIEAP